MTEWLEILAKIKWHQKLNSFASETGQLWGNLVNTTPANTPALVAKSSAAMIFIMQNEQVAAP